MRMQAYFIVIFNGKISRYLCSRVKVYHNHGLQLRITDVLHFYYKGYYNRLNNADGMLIFIIIELHL